MTFDNRTRILGALTECDAAVNEAEVAAADNILIEAVAADLDAAYDILLEAVAADDAAPIDISDLVGDLHDLRDAPDAESFAESLGNYIIMIIEADIGIDTTEDARGHIDALIRHGDCLESLDELEAAARRRGDEA